MPDIMAAIVESIRNYVKPKGNEVTSPQKASPDKEINKLIHSETDLWASPHTIDHFPLEKPVIHPVVESSTPESASFSQEQLRKARTILKSLHEPKIIPPDAVPQQSIDQVTDRVTDWIASPNGKLPKNLSGVEVLTPKAEIPKLKVVQGEVNDQGNILQFNTEVAKIEQKKAGS